MVKFPKVISIFCSTVFLQRKLFVRVRFIVVRVHMQTESMDANRKMIQTVYVSFLCVSN